MDDPMHGWTNGQMDKRSTKQTQANKQNKQTNQMNEQNEQMNGWENDQINE